MDVEAPVKAQRGDLIVVQYHPSYLDKGVVHVEVGMVTNVTRDGRVKRWRDAASEGSYTRDLQVAGYQASFVAPKVAIDVAAALATAAARQWPGGRRGMPYGSLDEARDALRPHLLSSEAQH